MFTAVRPATVTKTPLLSQSKFGAAVSMRVAAWQRRSPRSMSAVPRRLSRCSGQHRLIHVEQSAAVSPQCVADLDAGRAVRQDDLPRGAAAWQQVAIELRTGEHPAYQRHDPSTASQDIAEVQRLAHYRLEAVDLRQDRIGKFVDHAAERASPTAHIAPVYALVFRPNTQISRGHGAARARPGQYTSGFPGAITPAAARLC